MAEKQKQLKSEFETKLEAKINEVKGLDENLTAVEDYKGVYDKRADENKTEIAERAKVLTGAISETVEELNKAIDEKREKDFKDLLKYCEDNKTLKTKYEKQLSYFRQVFSSLPDDDDIVEQFVKDSIPKLDAMAISVKKDFPKPLKLITKTSTEMKDCFGKIEEDTYLSATGEEKPKYRSELEIEMKFKPERERSSIFGIAIRPDGKAWVTTLNHMIYLVLRSGKIYDEYHVPFLPIYTAVNKYGNLYCSSAQPAVHRVKKDYEISEFESFNPYKAFGIHVTDDERVLVCLQGPQGNSKVVVMSELGMMIQEIQNDQDNEPIFKTPKWLTQNANGQICVSDDRNLIIVEPSGKKYVKYRPTDETWEGKSLIVDKFDNLISSECPLKIRPQNIHIMNSRGESVKTFKLEGPKISGVNALSIDYQYDEPVMWIGTPLGDVIVAKFVNMDI